MIENIPNKPPTMNEEAKKTISELHTYEHIETMRWWSFFHNALLLIFVLILLLAFMKLWPLLTFVLWDFSYKKYPAKNKEKFISLYDRWESR